MTHTPFIDLTELWQDGKYNRVGNIIKKECWTPSLTAEFCLYFVKYLGIKELSVLYKFL